MKRTELPDAAFVDPSGANEEKVRLVAETVINGLLDQLSKADSRSPLPSHSQVPPAEIPDHSRDIDSLVEDLDIVMQNSMNPAHPGYIGHMDTVPTIVSALGDMVASALNNNMLSVEMSPIFSELEVRTIEEVATEFGLGPKAGGVLASGGSLANLHALSVARNQKFPVHGDGLTDLQRRPVLFASEAAHTSLQKAAMLLGLGTDAVIPVETDDNSRMRPSALETAIETARRDGQAPFCVVATAGTTTTGNIDPLPAIYETAQAHDLWFHVDAAYGGALVFSEEYRERLDGIENANSITFNPQKWCYVAKTCAMALFADEKDLESEFRVGAPYMQNEDEIPNLGELSVQGTRHADILKLWLTFQYLGRDGLSQLINERYRLTTMVHERIVAHDSLELASEPEMNILCFRAVPDGYQSETLDKLNSRLQETLLEEYNNFVSLPTYRDESWLRIVLLNPFTSEITIQRLFEGINEFLRSQTSK